MPYCNKDYILVTLHADGCLFCNKLLKMKGPNPQISPTFAIQPQGFIVRSSNFQH